MNSYHQSSPRVNSLATAHPTINFPPHHPITPSPHHPISPSPHHPITPSPHLPISPSPHLPITPSLVGSWWAVADHSFTAVGQFPC
ncbi:hypothetical protein [Moorena producens]|uniref:hypothetical protein n=1 Tax=Moorena producens TaxID=1155739 RepID=UPI003C72384B